MELWAIKHTGGCNNKILREYSIYNERDMAFTFLRRCGDTDCAVVRLDVIEIEELMRKENFNWDRVKEIGDADAKRKYDKRQAEILKEKNRLKALEDDFHVGDRVCTINNKKLVVTGIVTKVFKQTCHVKWDNPNYRCAIHKLAIEKGKEGGIQWIEENKEES